MDPIHYPQAVAFGDKLIETGDLDPVYIALHEAQLNFSVRARVLLAYTCLYHLGAAAAIAASKDFWLHLQVAARNVGNQWPRGTERRYWYKDNAMATWEYLAEHYKNPEDVIDYWMSGSLSFRAVADRVREIPGFGPWIAFKVADLLERVMEMPVDFRDCELGVYSEPRKGAALLVHGTTEHYISDNDLRHVVDTMLREPKFKRHKAPPASDRRLNIQEIETVLCKYKSHVNGHYPPGKDTHEVLHALSSRPWGRVAQKLHHAIKPLERHWR